jgi:effector-binding domain-containing protein
MQVQTLPEQTYFHVRKNTTFQDVERAMDEALADLSRAAEAGRVTFTGPPTFVYLGLTDELSRPFTLDVGYPVDEGTRPFGRFRVRTLDPLKAAAVTYTGPVSMIDKGYDRLIPAMEASGLQPAGETREVYLEWHGPDSEQNQALIGIGIK